MDGDGQADLFQNGYCDIGKVLEQLCADAELKKPRAFVPLTLAFRQDRIWRGDGNCVDVTSDWLSDHEGRRGRGIVIGARDDRQGVDVYVANDMTANHYWSPSA
jgi:hypothetical protein